MHYTPFLAWTLATHSESSWRQGLLECHQTCRSTLCLATNTVSDAGTLNLRRSSVTWALSQWRWWHTKLQRREHQGRGTWAKFECRSPLVAISLDTLWTVLPLTRSANSSRPSRRLLDSNTLLRCWRPRPCSSRWPDQHLVWMSVKNSENPTIFVHYVQTKLPGVAQFPI